MTSLRHLWKQMGNRAYSALAIHYTSRFGFPSSFSIILIISTVRWVARAEKAKKIRSGREMCVCGWQWCRGYLETVQISNSSIFSVTWGAFSEKKKNTPKMAWRRHGPRVKGLLTTAEQHYYFWLLPSLLAVMWFCFSSRDTEEPISYGTDHLLCILTMKKANVSQNTYYTSDIFWPMFFFAKQTAQVLMVSFTEFPIIKRRYPNLHCLFIYSRPNY